MESRKKTMKNTCFWVVGVEVRTIIRKLFEVLDGLRKGWSQQVASVRRSFGSTKISIHN